MPTAYFSSEALRNLSKGDKKNGAVSINHPQLHSLLLSQLPSTIIMPNSGPRYETSHTSGGTIWNVNGEVRHGGTHVGRDQVNDGYVSHNHGERRVRNPRRPVSVSSG